LHTPSFHYVSRKASLHSIPGFYAAHPLSTRNGSTRSGCKPFHFVTLSLHYIPLFASTFPTQLRAVFTAYALTPLYASKEYLSLTLEKIKPLYQIKKIAKVVGLTQAYTQRLSRSSPTGFDKKIYPLITFNIIQPLNYIIHSKDSSLLNFFLKNLDSLA
jgi:hypothetical protein